MQTVIIILYYCLIILAAECRLYFHQVNKYLAIHHENFSKAYKYSTM